METMAHWQQVSLSLPRCIYLFVSTAEGRWRNPGGPSSCLTPAGASTSLTSRKNGMTTHTDTHTQETSYVGINRAHMVLNCFPQENAHLTIYSKARRAARIYSLSRLHVDLPPTKMLLRHTEKLLVQYIFPSQARVWCCASIKRTGIIGY